jgi:hypothetical protein
LMQTVANLQLLTDPNPPTIRGSGANVGVIPRAYTDRSIYYKDINQDFPRTAAYHGLRNYIRYKYGQSDISDPTGAVFKLALPSSTLRGLLKDFTYDPAFVSHIEGPYDWIKLLLQSGTNPGWAWLQILRLGYFLTSQRGEKFRTQWMQLAKMFLGHGANPLALVTLAFVNLSTEGGNWSVSDENGVASGSLYRTFGWVIHYKIGLPEVLLKIAGGDIERYTAFLADLEIRTLPPPTPGVDIPNARGTTFDTEEGVIYKEKSQSRRLLLRTVETTN